VRTLLLSLLACIALVASACSPDIDGFGPVLDPDGYDTADYNATAAGYPSQAKIDQARAHALDFWFSRMNPTENIRTCLRNAQIGPYTDATLKHVGLARGCWTQLDNSEPAYDVAGQGGQIGINTAYRWTYKRLCVVMTHEFGHLLSIMHSNTHYAVMDKTPYIGEGACPR
jgi:hypothetical protein